MKKFLFTLVFLGVLAAGGYAAYLYLLSPETVYCTQIVRLCEADDPDVLQGCKDLLVNVAEKNPQAVRDLARCSMEAKSCSQGLGCAVGAGADLGLTKLAPLFTKTSGVLNDFVDGMKKGASDLLD